MNSDSDIAIQVMFIMNTAL